MSFAVVANNSNYENIIDQHAEQWTTTYIANAPNHETQTIIDLLLLSYQIVETSCAMIVAKFTIQEEIFKIYTPSFIDSWHENLQINQNDTRKLEQSICAIKDAQHKLQTIYAKFQKLLPFIIKINPQPTQTIISDLKDCLIAWGKEQQIVTEQLFAVQSEFSQVIANIAEIKPLFETITQSPELKHTYLKETASFFAKTYKNIDIVIDHFTKTRIEGVLKIQEFFKEFFKRYYLMIYNTSKNDQIDRLTILATSDQKPPLPGAFFA
tara:strand:+ start:2627 stop:3427 length:801 start_codon:yes stop_codon:yes gene_type:complete